MFAELGSHGTEAAAWQVWARMRLLLPAPGCLVPGWEHQKSNADICQSVGTKRPFAITRIFCVFEVKTTVASDATFTVQLPPDEEREGQRELKQNPELVNAVEVDVERAQSSNPEDKAAILEDLRPPLASTRLTGL